MLANIDLEYMNFLKNKKLSGQEILVFLYLRMRIIDDNYHPSITNISNALHLTIGGVGYILQRLKYKKVISSSKKIENNSIKTNYVIKDKS